MKLCTKCGKPGKFCHRKGTRDGLEYQCLVCANERKKKFRKLHRQEKNQYLYDYKLRIKIEVLTKYGKEQQLCCCWPECGITDVDLLTLDHIDDDGAEQRRLGERTGKALYLELRVGGYPEGYQTLCWNHQWKKRLEHLRRMAGRL